VETCDSASRLKLLATSQGLGRDIKRRARDRCVATEVDMVKRLVPAVLATAIAASFASLAAFQSRPPGARCLHGSLEAPVHEMRRNQALRLARQINLAESGVTRLPTLPRRFRPLEELPNLPSPPVDFKMQFHTDGASYLFSLKDTADPCRYAIFSDQDQGIYEGTAGPAGVRVVPADIP
jgi:hypothetical protein